MTKRACNRPGPVAPIVDEVVDELVDVDEEVNVALDVDVSELFLLKGTDETLALPAPDISWTTLCGGTGGTTCTPVTSECRCAPICALATSLSLSFEAVTLEGPGASIRHTVTTG